MKDGIRPLVLDAGALIGFEGRDRRIAVLIQAAREVRAPIAIPAGVLAQVWRNGARQARLAALLGDQIVLVADLTAIRAKAIGELCGRQRKTDIVDASVVLLARQIGGLIISGDPEDLRALDPLADLVVV